jgi:hypothetical protein
MAAQEFGGRFIGLAEVTPHSARRPPLKPTGPLIYEGPVTSVGLNLGRRADSSRLGWIGGTIWI